jgi:hypothetical protein
MVDVQDVDNGADVVDLVDHPVCTDPGRVQTLEFSAERFSDGSGVLEERTEDEVEHSHGDL